MTDTRSVHLPLLLSVTESIVVTIDEFGLLVLRGPANKYAIFWYR